MAAVRLAVEVRKVELGVARTPPVIITATATIPTKAAADVRVVAAAAATVAAARVPTARTFGRAEAIVACLLVVVVALLELLGAGDAPVMRVEAVVHGGELRQDLVQLVTVARQDRSRAGHG